LLLIADVGVAGLRHFIYKSRKYVQYTTPTFMAPYNDPREKRKYEIRLRIFSFLFLFFFFFKKKRINSINSSIYFYFRLFKLYRYTHDRMHSRIRPLKVHYYVSPSETILGWVCYIIASLNNRLYQLY
jgi:vacuolar fusion protein MON1